MLAAKTNELDIIEALLNVEAIECSGTIFNEVYTLIKTIEIAVKICLPSIKLKRIKILDKKLFRFILLI
jgi:hypothetical protein